MYAKCFMFFIFSKKNAIIENKNEFYRKKKVRQSQAYINNFQTLQFELYWTGFEDNKVFEDILLICMCLRCVKKKFSPRQTLSWISHLLIMRAAEDSLERSQNITSWYETSLE